MATMEQAVMAMQNDIAAFKVLEAQHNIDTNNKVVELANKMDKALNDLITLQWTTFRPT